MSHNESASGVESCQLVGKCDLINGVSSYISVARKNHNSEKKN